MFTTFQKTDAEIQFQICEELRWDCRTEGNPIAVVVNRGEVTLSGSVKNYAIKRAAEEATHRIAGVDAVVNDLVVKIPYLEFVADSEIAQAAMSTFRWNVLIPHESITVFVAQGWVSLVGSVDCWSQREEVERAVSVLAGVRGVKNKIVVKAAPIEPERVCESIEASLQRHWPQEARDVHIAIEGGTVRLSGHVPSWGERHLAMCEAGFAPGVRQVVDELKVIING